jgi:hypothetical protein
LMRKELEKTLRSVKHLSAKGIYQAIIDRARSFAPPTDDVTLVVIKRSGLHRGA